MALHLEVLVAGRDVDRARDELGPVLGLDHASRTDAVETRGELAREDRRHVLDHQDRDARGAYETGDQLGQRLGPPVDDPITMARTG